MFQTPTVEGLARRAVAAQAGGKGSREPIPIVPRDGSLLPSLNQEALWFLDQLERDRPTYTVYPTMRLRGPLDVPVLGAGVERDSPTTRVVANPVA